jgi:predicted nicotinamide N-methyase
MYSNLKTLLYRDAALAAIIFLEQVITGTEKSMPALGRLLNSGKSSVQVVELGAGCGIVGIALATMLANCEILLTDLPEVSEIVTRNINEASPKSSASIKFQTLDWDEPMPNLTQGPIDLILVSDCTYNADSLPALVSVLGRLVRGSPGAMVLVALKRRHESEAVFFDLMRDARFVSLQAKVPLPAQWEQADQIEMHCYQQESGVENA